LPQPSETTLVFVRVKPDSKPGTTACAEETRLESLASVLPVRDVTPAADSAPVAAHPRTIKRRKSRKSVPGASLASLGIFSSRQIALLRQIDCRTDRHLRRLTPQRLEKRLAEYVAAQHQCPDAPLAPPIDRIRLLVRRGRWAIRFANQFDDMMPRESLFLRAVHRGSRQTLSRDSAGMIRRDLQRLALSSRGKRLVTLDQVPDLQRLKGWITAAREAQIQKSHSPSNRGNLGRVSASEDSQTDVTMVPR
jgi:hypothetical protein